jgi:dCMP deaminase
MSAMTRGEEYKPTNMRESKDNYYLDIAKAVAMRGTCIRRKFGAVIVNNDEIVSTGYVGAPRGRCNCIDRGVCFREEKNIKPGTRYELCRSVHAEMNAVISAGRNKCIGGTMYLVGIENDGSFTDADCCSMCKRVIINAGIRYVVIAKPTGHSMKVPVETWVYEDDSLHLHEGY